MLSMFPGDLDTHRNPILTTLCSKSKRLQYSLKLSFEDHERREDQIEILNAFNPISTKLIQV